MGTTLPPSTDYTGVVTQGDKKTFIAAMRSFIADLFGTDSTMATAHAAFKNFGAGTMNNAALAASVAANALTIALKTAAGTDPSVSDPVLHTFRSATASSGTPTILAANAAQSLVIPSGATMGATSGVPFRLWIVQFNNGGTLRLGAINCLNGNIIYALRDDILASSTAVSVSADNAHVIYTGSAVTNKALRVLGYMEWPSGLTTAGTWDAGPSIIQMFAPGQALPGTVVSRAYGEYTTNSNLTAQIPFDNTIPQNSEGSEIISLTTAPLQSVTHRLRIRFHGQTVCGSAANVITALFSGASASALRSDIVSVPAADCLVPAILKYEYAPGVTTAVVLSVRVGPGTGVTIRFNGAVSGGLMGGSMAATLMVEEIAV